MLVYRRNAPRAASHSTKLCSWFLFGRSLGSRKKRRNDGVGWRRTASVDPPNNPSQAMRRKPEKVDAGFLFFYFLLEFDNAGGFKQRQAAERRGLVE